MSEDNTLCAGELMPNLQSTIDVMADKLVPVNNIATNTNLILSGLRQTDFWSLMRSTPATLFMSLILMSIQNPTVDNYLFIIFYMGVFILNGVLKFTFQGIYSILNTDYIPLIGQGSRPIGAHSSSAFMHVPLIPATTYGMPSGHSQLAWFFATYACLNIINSRFTYFQNLQISWNGPLQALCCTTLILLAGIISYSRVYIEECHTPGQVIVGGLIGIVSGVFAYKIKKWLKSNYL